jgi:hypothetical protein
VTAISHPVPRDGADANQGKRESRKIREAAQRSGFVWLDVKHSHEACDLKNIAHPPGEMDEFQFAVRLANRSVRRDHLAESVTVDVVDIAEIEKDFAVSGIQKFVDESPQGRTVAERDFSAQVNHRDVTGLTPRF